jgi:hypothetical protein
VSEVARCIYATAVVLILLAVMLFVTMRET